MCHIGARGLLLATVCLVGARGRITVCLDGAGGLIHATVCLVGGRVLLHTDIALPIVPYKTYIESVSPRL